uniref:Uncharacterized protein n=1 Tax=Rhizophora mucronata TaxID=61149 RepID=A0A2P2Q0V4_RHIMU
MFPHSKAITTTSQDYIWLLKVSQKS